MLGFPKTPCAPVSEPADEKRCVPIRFFLHAAACTVLLLCLLSLARPSLAQSPCLGEESFFFHEDVRLNVEIAGDGKSVILLHGNGGSHRDLSCMTEQLVLAGYRVYAMDSRGQGESSSVEELHYADMAGDVHALIEFFGLDRPAVYGWSDGGIVALELALLYPEDAGLLAVSGANLWPEAIDGIDDGSLDLDDPLDRLVATEPHIDPEALGCIDMPVLVTAGEWDLIRPAHTALIAASIPRATLCILGGEDHDSYIEESDVMGEILLAFLKCCGY